MKLAGLDSFWLGSILVLVITGIYTTLGGFRAVAYTEAVQTVILIVGSALVTYYGLAEIGGWHELRDTIGHDKFNLWKPLVPDGIEGTWNPVEVTNDTGEIVRKAWYFDFPGHYPWLGMLFCAPIIGLWYWCTDQYIVQRALGAPNETEARRGSIFAGILKLLPVFIFIIPGMICWGLILKTNDTATIEANSALASMDFSEMLGDAVDGQPTIAESGKAFPMMVKNVLPAGVRGIVVAGLLSALMSSLAGVFQRLLDTVHDGHLQEISPECSRASARESGPHSHGRDGDNRTGVDSGHQRLARAVRLSAIGAGLLGTTDLRGFLLGYLLETA